MRVVVTGATGNVGTSVLYALSTDPAVESIVGLARRMPTSWTPEKVTWRSADVAADPLEPLFRGADAVVHLAWLIQPSRDEAKLEAVNVDGTRRVFEAAAAAGVGALVNASSVGAYSPGPKDQAVDESWPTEGIDSSFYARHKAAAERILDGYEDAFRSVRLRPALIFKRDAATGVRRLFAGPLLPSRLVHRRIVRVVPDVARLRFQAVHSLDVGDAYRRAVVNPEARGAYNVAADPVLDADSLAELFGAVKLPLPASLLRFGAWATWRARLQPTPPGWLDMALAVPLLDPSRISDELGWAPRHNADDALLELIEGMHDRAGLPTPPLDPATSGRFRRRELMQGVGAREP